LKQQRLKEWPEKALKGSLPWVGLTLIPLSAVLLGLQIPKAKATRAAPVGEVYLPAMHVDPTTLSRTYFEASIKRDFARCASLIYPGDVDKFKTNMLWCAAAMDRFGESSEFLSVFGDNVDIEDLRVLSPEAFLVKLLENTGGSMKASDWEQIVQSFKPGELTDQTSEDRASMSYSYEMVVQGESITVEREIQFQRVQGRWYVLLNEGIRRVSENIGSKVRDFEQREKKDRKLDSEADLDPFALWGFKDEAGQTIIEPRFREALEFKDGLAPVKFFRKWGFIRKDGTTAIKPAFDRADIFSEGFAAPAIYDDSLNLLWGYVNTTGAIVIKHQFSSAQPFEDGFARVTLKRDEREVSGRVDSKGKFKEEQPD
jgi:hypothetical protein